MDYRMPSVLHTVRERRVKAEWKNLLYWLGIDLLANYINLTVTVETRTVDFFSNVAKSPEVGVRCPF